MASQTSAVPKPLEQMDYQNVEGVNYLTLGFLDNVAEFQTTMRNLQMRDYDVIVVGFPRTGNHWAQEMVSMIMRQDSTFDCPLIYKTMLETLGRKVVEELEVMPSPRVLFTHYRINRIPLQAIEKRLKIIYLLRNPKDTMASQYRLMSNFVFDTYSFKGSWDEFFELQMVGEVPWGTWVDHLLATEKFMKEHPECPVYINSFEKLKLDPVACVKELCTFLGKPTDLAEDIAIATEFKNMKGTLFAGKLKKELELFKQGSDALFQKGIIGGWKNYFTVAQSERYDKMLEQKLGGCKLAELVREYI